MSHKDDMLRAAECAETHALNFREHETSDEHKEYLALASRLREAIPIADDLSAARRELAEARDGALEEAAKVCDLVWQESNSLQISKIAGQLAKNIRALKSPAQGTTPAKLERKP